ncbi:MAG: phosphate/phosphite/phosphonate ABC transporter substrate-binding protein [Deltaproteobacteria bacterium]|nr:phosphate/phosphite/phosphonate ABC transporter substrate-binding protein [Deltaproteobacteria bacterium]
MSLDSQQTPIRLGRYDVIDRIAVGGMADIFLAVERGAHGFERRVVIKRILEHLSTQETFRQMFLQEARIAAQITHPNVVQIHELGEQGGLPYLVMEYMAGITLRELTRITEDAAIPIPTSVAVELVVQACAGAHAVHELADPHGKPYGLVHRDMTPHNLMVNREGWVKLLDFGIAKGHDSEDFTRTGMLKGKLAYMSPEQVQTLPLDRRSDVFALGVLLWELLAGERLFRRDTEIGTLRAILNHELRDLRAIRPHLPEPILLVMERALAQSPDDRWQSADAMRRALLGAASSVDLELSRDGVGDFLERMAGDRLAANARTIGDALERSLTMTSSARTKTMTRTANPATASLVGAVGALVTVLSLTVLTVAVSAFVGGSTWYWMSRPIPRPEGPPVVLALAPVHDEAALMEEWLPLRVWLEQQTDQRVDLVMLPSYEDTSEALLSAEVQFAALPPAVYIATHAKDSRVVPLVNTVVDGSDGYDALLLIGDRSSVTDVHGLVGSHICFTDPGSSSGYLLPRLALRRAGLELERDFAEVRFSGSHDQAIQDLVDGRCDVAATYTDALVAASTRGVATGTTRILTVTGRAIHDAICAGPETDPAVSSLIREALLRFDPQQALGGPKLGEVTQITGFQPGEDARYDSLREALTDK